MNKEALYITSWVTLRSNEAVCNGTVFFERKAADPVTFLKELVRKLNCEYPKFFKMDNLSKLAFAGTELLLKDHPLRYPAGEVALVFSNASSSLDTDRTYYHSVEDKSNYFPSPAVFVYTLPNIMMGEICIRHKFQGENAFFISEKFDAELLTGYIEHLFSSGKAKCVIAAWVEIGETSRDAALFLVERHDKKESSQKRLSKESLDEIYAR